MPSRIIPHPDTNPVGTTATLRELPFIHSFVLFWWRLNRVLLHRLVRLARVSELRSAFVIEIEDLTIVMTSFAAEFVDFATIALL